MQSTTQLAQKLDKLIKESSSIMLVCHTGADVDALASIIALKKILEVNYAKDRVTAVGERIPKSLAFMPDFTAVVNGSVLELLKKESPELVIFADFSQIHMASKQDASEIQDYLKKAGTTFVVIDHHPETYKNLDAELYLNLEPSSTAMNIHLVFHERLKLPVVPAVADALLYGTIADTNRFKYKYGASSQAPVLKTAASLLEVATLSIEDIANNLDRMDLGTMKIVSAFVENIKLINETFALTTLSIDELAQRGLDTTKLGDAAQYTANNIISLIDTATHGAVIYPHLPEENTYTVRFRSSSEHYPVDRYASALGGGGHAQSAAARIKAENAEEAIKKVLEITA